MRDPLHDPFGLIEPVPACEYYETLKKPAGGWPKRTQPSVKSENKLHSNFRLLVREKDVLIRQVNVLTIELKSTKRWLKLITAALVTSWAFWCVAMKFLIPYAVKGMLAH